MGSGVYETVISALVPDLSAVIPLKRSSVFVPDWFDVASPQSVVMLLKCLRT